MNVKKRLYNIFEYFRNSFYRNYVHFTLFEHKNISILGKKFSVNNYLSFITQYYHIFYKEVYFFKSNKVNPIILDCGGNLGLSVLYFKYLYQHSRITVYEPDPKIYKVLKENCSHFNGIEYVNVAVGDQDEQVSFYPKEGDDGSLYNAQQENKITVSMINLNKKLEGLEEVDFLKIDIEGGETELLKSIQSQLEKIQNIFIDFHTSLNTKNQSLANVLDILEKNNFWYRITPEYELKGSQQKYANQTYLSYGIMARRLV